MTAIRLSTAKFFNNKIKKNAKKWILIISVSECEFFVENKFPKIQQMHK